MPAPTTNWGLVTVFGTYVDWKGNAIVGTVTFTQIGRAHV